MQSVPGTPPIVSRLLQSDEPSVRYLTLTRVLGLPESDPQVRSTREEVRGSERVRRLLSIRAADGRIPGHPYNKWTGAHWVLSHLADLGYPEGDTDLYPLRDQVYAAWLSERHTKERVCASRSASYAVSGGGVAVIDGRPRRCGSQEGNALFSTLALGIADERGNQLASNLIRWQWPDGGWNCDRRAEAVNSSYHETFLPLRALALHARITGDAASRQSADRAAEVLLKRKLFRRLADGSVINPRMVQLHYPCYWHYDILVGLKVMSEAGFIHDPRCSDALELLESKRLADGGLPAEGKYYRRSEEPSNSASLVDWGGVSKTRMNEFVTVEALGVLQAAGRLS